MEIPLDKAALEKLPAPGEDGIIRCNAGLKMGGDGKAMLVSLNDMPVGKMPDSESEESDEAPADERAYTDDASKALANL